MEKFDNNQEENINDLNQEGYEKEETVDKKENEEKLKPENKKM